MKEKLRRKLPALFRLLRRLRRLPRRLIPSRLRAYPRDAGFQGDLVLQNMVRRLGASGKITAAVETGTWQGGTTLFLSEVLPSARIYTTESDSEYYRESRRRLRDKPNIELHNLSSPDFLRRLLPQKVLGDCPFFFLDAHVYDEAPLLEELRLLRELPRAVILIHDFEVPDKPAFGFDLYRLEDELVPNSFKFIRPELLPGDAFFLPDYSAQEAFPPPVAQNLRGHLLILRNFQSADVSRLVEEGVFRGYVRRIFPDQG